MFLTTSISRPSRRRRRRRRRRIRAMRWRLKAIERPQQRSRQALCHKLFSMQAALKEFLILPPTPENKALFLSQWPLASLFGAITETGDKLNDLIVRRAFFAVL